MICSLGLIFFFRHYVYVNMWQSYIKIKKWSLKFKSKIKQRTKLYVEMMAYSRPNKLFQVSLKFSNLPIYSYPCWNTSLFFSLFFFLNWSIVDLQCCVSFRCKAKWFRYTYIYFFFIFFSNMVYHRILNIVPCAIQ